MPVLSVSHIMFFVETTRRITNDETVQKLVVHQSFLGSTL